MPCGEAQINNAIFILFMNVFFPKDGMGRGRRGGAFMGHVCDGLVAQAADRTGLLQLLFC